MNTETIPLDYANNFMYELEKAFWDERGKGARFRMTNVGKQFFIDKCLPALESSELDHILKTISQILESQGIAGQVNYDNEERLLRVQVQGCIHRPVEEKMLANGVEPFTCIPANLIAFAIEEKLDRPVELAEIKVEEGTCQLLLVVFGQQPTLA